MGKYGNKIREDKSVLTEPRCPFCREKFSPPREISTELGFFTGGICVCKAVYSYDPSGKNQGEAFMDALVYACGEDWDMALSLEPDTDYEQASISYDFHHHTIASGVRNRNPFSRYSDLIFIKINRQSPVSDNPGGD